MMQPTTTLQTFYTKEIGDFHYRIQVNIIGVIFISIKESPHLYFINYKSILGFKNYKLHRCLVYTKEAAIQATFDRYIEECSLKKAKDDSNFVDKLGKKIFGFFVSSKLRLDYVDNFHTRINREKFITSQINKFKRKFMDKKEQHKFAILNESIYGIETFVDKNEFFNPRRDFIVGIKNMTKDSWPEIIPDQGKDLLINRKRKLVENHEKLNLLIEFFVQENTFFQSIKKSWSDEFINVKKYLKKMKNIDLSQIIYSVILIHENIVFNLDGIFKKSKILHDKILEIIDEGIVKLQTLININNELDFESNDDLDEAIKLIFMVFDQIDFQCYINLVSNFEAIKYFIENKTNLKSREMNAFINFVLHCIHKFTKYIFVLGNMTLCLNNDIIFDQTHGTLLKINQIVSTLNAMQEIQERNNYTRLIKSVVKNVPPFIFCDSRYFVNFIDFNDSNGFTLFLFNDSLMITKRKGGRTMIASISNNSYKFIDFILLSDLTLLKDIRGEVVLFVYQNEVFEITRFKEEAKFFDGCIREKMKFKGCNYLRKYSLPNSMNLHYIMGECDSVDLQIVISDSKDSINQTKESLTIIINDMVELCMDEFYMKIERDQFFTNFDRIISTIANNLLSSFDYLVDEMFVVCNNFQFLNEINKIVVRFDKIYSYTEILSLCKQIRILLKECSKESIDILKNNNITEFDQSIPDDLSIIVNHIAVVVRFFRYLISFLFNFEEISIINQHFISNSDLKFIKTINEKDLNPFIEIFSFLNELIHSLRLDYLRKIFYAFFNECKFSDVDRALLLLLETT